MLTTLEVCYEFYLRGFTFDNIDLYASHATKFLIRDGRLLPPFVSVSGLGESAAWDIMEGREGKHFVSIEEFSAACPKVSKTHIENLKQAGAFGDLPDTSQITLLIKEPLNKSAAALSGSFAPTYRFENLEILRSRWRLCRLTDAACPLRVHKVFLQFPNLNLEQNPSLTALAF